MSYKHFSIEERCCLREYYVKGKSYRGIAKLLGRNVSSVLRELRRNCTLQRYPEILSTYGTKEKQFKEFISAPRNVLERRSIGHRRKDCTNVVAGANIKNALRNENAVVQDDISVDRRKIPAIHVEVLRKKGKRESD